ncbi:MAG: FMN-dependent NADH-azoreductase [Gammaproteobacteria bacterium]|nr:FMN-dependent NADH-azoreductase [Gammaproteobacteria bacterium]
MHDTKRILRLDASANPADSSSRKLRDHLHRQITRSHPSVETRERDLNRNLSFIDSHWIAANFTTSEERAAAQTDRLAFSDELIDELKWSDHIVLTTPMYNFSIPATLKAWIDLVCRAGVTFRYTDNGPEGLLDGKSVDIVVTTGGVPMDSPLDFVSGYLRQVFTFIGINKVSIVGADQMNVDSDASFNRAMERIDQHYPAVEARRLT